MATCPKSGKTVKLKASDVCFICAKTPAIEVRDPETDKLIRLDVSHQSTKPTYVTFWGTLLWKKVNDKWKRYYNCSAFDLTCDAHRRRGRYNIPPDPIITDGQPEIDEQTKRPRAGNPDKTTTESVEPIPIK